MIFLNEARYQQERRPQETFDSEVVQLRVRTQMSLGGAPERTLRSSKSESFETIVKPLVLAYSQIAASSVLPNPH